MEPELFIVIATSHEDFFLVQGFHSFREAEAFKEFKEQSDPNHTYYVDQVFITERAQRDAL